MLWQKFTSETRDIFNKVKTCPRCNNELETGFKKHKIECPRCGLLIQIDSAFNKRTERMISSILIAFTLGFLTLLALAIATA